MQAACYICGKDCGPDRPRAKVSHWKCAYNSMQQARENMGNKMAMEIFQTTEDENHFSNETQLSAIRFVGRGIRGDQKRLCLELHIHGKEWYSDAAICLTGDQALALADAIKESFI